MKFEFFANHKRPIKSKRANEVKIVSGDDKNEGWCDLGGNYWRYYCKNTSIHGIKYTTEPGLHWIERLTWLIFVSFATFGVIYVSILLSERYNTSPLSTVVESTHYPISEIPFPAVSLCNSNRINWNKINEAYRKFIPLPLQSNDTVVAFQHLLKCFNKLDFGSFDEFLPVLETNLTFMESVNITAVLEFLMILPEDLLVKCWWRNKYFECDDLFAKQKTEYGFCISFNSYSSYGAPLTHKNMTYFPWRTHSYSLWSALRITIKQIHQPDIEARNNGTGLNLIIHHPAEWPNIGYFIPSFSATAISIQPTIFYTSPDVERYTPYQRQCVYSDEVSLYDIMALNGLPYQRPNCMAECRQRYMLKFCNCTVDFFYDPGVYRPCNIKGLLCMYRFNDVFNFEKPLELNEYFDDREEGIICPCLPECTRIGYEVEIQPNLLNYEDSIYTTMDIHFHAMTMVKYRTDVTFGWMDLVVAFGGVVGLFLGCSLLSGAEIIYYLTIGFYWFAKRQRVDRNSSRLPTENMLILEWTKRFGKRLGDKKYTNPN